MENLKKVLDPVFYVTRIVTVVLVSLMVAVATYEISLRTFTGNTPSWSKELTLLAMVWMGFLGSAYLHRERGHITIEFIVDSLARGKRRGIMLGVDLLLLGFSAFLTVAGVIVVFEFLNQSLPGTRMPVGYSYIPIPVSGVLLFLACLEHVLKDLKGEEVPDAE